MRYKTMNKPLKYTDMVDFRTPKYLFKFINSLHEIEFDAACTPGLNNLAKPLRLEEEWPNGIIYSNPPFDNQSIIKWAKKGFKHSRKKKENVHIMLIPNKITQVEIQKEAFELFDELIFLGGRVNFDSPYSTKGGSSRNGSIIIIQNNGVKRFSNVLLSELKERFQ